MDRVEQPDLLIAALLLGFAGGLAFSLLLKGE